MEGGSGKGLSVRFGNIGKINWTSVDKFAIFYKGNRIETPNYFGGGLCILGV